MSLSLLDGEFAYAEPLRLALQQLSWGKPSPLDAPEELSVALAVTAGRRRARPVAAPVQGRDRDLPPQDDRLRLLHDRPRRHGVAQGRPLPPALQGRPVLPDRLLARARRHARVPRLADPRARSATRPRPSTTSTAPRTSTRASTPSAPIGSSASRSGARASGCRTASTGSRCATSATPAQVTEADDGVIFETDYANARQMVSWVLGLGEHARVEGPPELVDEWRAAARARDRAPHDGARAGQGGRARSSRRSRTRRTARARRSARSASPGWSRSRAS